ncbi:histone acetyltransferase p300-like [Sycon ciliatum]|uniref:histone acetyltransferase p300-like n=1 Tax=Sycon ciliatum TaxID=27933 RepID=UPI0031F61F0E
MSTPTTSLPRNALATYPEERINAYLTTADTNREAGHVHIRVLSSSKQTVKVKDATKEKFEELSATSFPEEFPYVAKSVFAFVEIDGKDVCFFGMIVHVFASDSPEPNRRYVYLPYLDSVDFFPPKQSRTQVYYGLLIAYKDYVAKRGFAAVNLWACPPGKNKDYIFNLSSTWAKDTHTTASNTVVQDNAGQCSCSKSCYRV